MRNRVRVQRTQREVSQAELAAALGVSPQTVISIESGRQRMSQLVPGLRLISGHTHAGRQAPAGASR